METPLERMYVWQHILPLPVARAHPMDLEEAKKSHFNSKTLHKRAMKSALLYHQYGLED